MPRYIDADALKEQIALCSKILKNGKKDNLQYMIGVSSTLLQIYNWVDKVQTADVAPVLRCKDCRNFRQYHNSETDGLCFINTDGVVYMKTDDFCSYGERRNDG